MNKVDVNTQLDTDFEDRVVKAVGVARVGTSARISWNERISSTIAKTEQMFLTLICVGIITLRDTFALCADLIGRTSTRAVGYW